MVKLLGHQPAVAPDCCRGLPDPLWSKAHTRLFGHQFLLDEPHESILLHGIVFSSHGRATVRTNVLLKP